MSITTHAEPHRIKCGHCHSEHQDTGEVLTCAISHGVLGVPATVPTSAPAPAAPPSPVGLPTAIPGRYLTSEGGPRWWYDRPSPAQLTKIGKLGGDEVLANRLNKKGCSVYIDDLIRNHPGTPRAGAPTAPMTTDPRFPHPGDGHPFAWGSRTSGGIDICATCSRAHPEPDGKVEPLSPLKALLPGLGDGYYASRLEDGAPYKFFRISRPKRGKYNGGIKVQTQAGPSLDLYAVFYPENGRVYTYQNGRWDRELMLIFADQKWAAMKYGQELGHCCRCNTELTDPRSRWYGIGPECETYWPEILEMVERDKGVFDPAVTS